MYEVINENLGIAKCSLMDLTAEQVNQFLGQWEPGANIDSLILFYDKENDLIVLNGSSKGYQFWIDIVEAYLIAEGEEKKRFEEEFDKYSKDIRKVLDNCIRERTIRRELFIAEQQVFVHARYRTDIVLVIVHLALLPVKMTLCCNIINCIVSFIYFTYRLL